MTPPKTEIYEPAMNISKVNFIATAIIPVIARYLKLSEC